MLRLLIIVLVSFFSCPAFAQDADTANAPAQDIVVYFKSGEIIKGRLISQTDEKLEIQRNESVLSFAAADILKTTDGKDPIQSSSPSKEPIPFSTAIITYQYSGGGQGTETIYIDMTRNSIDKESHVTWTMAGTSRIKNERVMYDGYKHYTFDLERNIAIEEAANQHDAIAVMFASPESVGSYEGVEQVLGRECQLYKGTLVTECSWNGIVLKESAVNPLSSDLNYSKEAVDIQLDVPIPDGKFIINSNIKIQSAEEAMQELQDMFKKKTRM